jgi:hypothetical protein
MGIGTTSIFVPPGFNYRASEEEIWLEFSTNLNRVRERQYYQKEIFNYVYGDHIPDEIAMEFDNKQQIIDYMIKYKISVPDGERDREH